MVLPILSCVSGNVARNAIIVTLIVNRFNVVSHVVRFPALKLGRAHDGALAGVMWTDSH